MLFSFLNKLNKARPNHIYIGLALSPLACLILYSIAGCCQQQRWSPRGHILKSLALASKVKSLASRPQVLENWPVLGSRTALFFGMLKFCGALDKIFWKTFFSGDRLKNFCEDLFFFFLFFFGDRLKNFCEDLFFCLFWRALALCVLGPWPRECLSSERLSLALASEFFCVLGLGLEPCVLDSTSGQQATIYRYCNYTRKRLSK